MVVRSNSTVTQTTTNPKVHRLLSLKLACLSSTTPIVCVLHCMPQATASQRQLSKTSSPLPSSVTVWPTSRFWPNRLLRQACWHSRKSSLAKAATGSRLLRSTMTTHELEPSWPSARVCVLTTIWAPTWLCRSMPIRCKWIRAAFQMQSLSPKHAMPTPVR